MSNGARENNNETLCVKARFGVHFTFDSRKAAT
jgi:hypothetical protein